MKVGSKQPDELSEWTQSVKLCPFLFFCHVSVQPQKTFNYFILLLLTSCFGGFEPLNRRGLHILLREEKRFLFFFLLHEQMLENKQQAAEFGAVKPE